MTAIAFVLKGYPRLSETFIAQEILALERAGLDLRIVSLRHPTDRQQHPVNGQIRAPVSYLPEYLHQEPVRVLRAWRYWRTRAGYARVWKLFLADLRRDRSRNRLRRFGQALVLAAELPAVVGHLHAHFLHTPASVARYAAQLLGLSWSASAHARDIWTSAPWELKEKLAEARFVVTCTALNSRHLRSLCPQPERVDLVYHGLDLERFASPAGKAGGAAAGAAVRILSVGRAVEKKGYPVLLEALARLPADLDWNLQHAGGGPLLTALKRRAARLGIARRIRWHGAVTQQQVLELYRRADIFALSPQVAADGDMDGLPNVLMEAQSQRLACIASRLSAIPELIEDQVTGILVPPGDAAALARGLERLIRDSRLRLRLAAAGEQRVRRDFAMQGGIDRLLGHFSHVGESG